MIVYIFVIRLYIKKKKNLILKSYVLQTTLEIKLVEKLQLSSIEFSSNINISKTTVMVNLLEFILLGMSSNDV